MGWGFGSWRGKGGSSEGSGGAVQEGAEGGFGSLAGPHRTAGQAQQPTKGLTQAPVDINDRDAGSWWHSFCSIAYFIPETYCPLVQLPVPQLGERAAFQKARFVGQPAQLLDF